MNTPAPKSRSRQSILGVFSVTLLLLAAACGNAATSSSNLSAPASHGSGAAATTSSTTSTTTTVPCALAGTPGTANTVPIDQVCAPATTPRFDSPDAAMTYLATAWNSNNIQDLDWVTDPSGRQEMDSMASLMVNLQFKSCTQNPTNDYTCYFMHDIAPSTSSTTYPDPGGYPPGEAVFTVGPADAPGWYLTNVVHCG